MSKIPFLSRYLLILLLLLVRAPSLQAQEEIVVDSTILSSDTVQVVEEVVDQEKEDPFQPAGEKQVQLSPRRLPAGELEKIKSEKKYWFADSAFVKKAKSRYGRPFFMQDWVKVLFWILVVGGFAVALALFLYKNNIRLFRKKDTRAAELASDELPQSIFDIDYEKELQKALAAKDLRLAVRLQFLSMLRLLSDKGAIQYRQDRTNMDYIFQLNSKNYYPEFFRVVRHYEYSWYGHFEVASEDYQRIDQDFQKLREKLP